MPLDPALYGPFLVVASAAILSPGPDTLLILRATLNGGQSHGLAALVGVQIGLLGHFAAAVFGISLLVMAVPLALQATAISARRSGDRPTAPPHPMVRWSGGFAAAPCGAMRC